MYGIDNVRGGSYILPTIDLIIQKMLETEFRTADNVCFNCGQHGHFIKQCLLPTNNLLIEQTQREPLKNNCVVIPNQQSVSNIGSDHKCDKCGKLFQTVNGLNYHKNIYCEKSTQQSVTNIGSDHKCDKCGKLFQTANGLNYHKNIYCGKSTQQKLFIYNKRNK